jgi:hypothetical protein
VRAHVKGSRPRGDYPGPAAIYAGHRIVMLSEQHHDANLRSMRTTVTLATDVAAAVERLRRERALGMSEAVNELIRDGLARGRPARPFVQETHDLGAGLDYTNIGDALETLDGPSAG